MTRRPRLGKPEFWKLLAGHDAEALRKVLWELYVRGGAQLQERIERVCVPRAARPPKPERPPIDGEDHLAEVRRFVDLARSGAYMGGTRLVSRSERTKWRVPFREMLDASSELLLQGDLENGSKAMELLLSLALDSRDTYHFRTEDPISALRLVVSDRVALLWRATADIAGFAALVARVPLDLIRWESTSGWTRDGTGAVAAKERPLAEVLAEHLPSQDAWLAVADAWISTLENATAGRSRGSDARGRRTADGLLPQRWRAFERWHALLYSRLRLTEGHDRLRRLASIPLDGVDHHVLRVKVARDDGKLDDARRHAAAGLASWPGSDELAALAAELGVPGPVRRSG